MPAPAAPAQAAFPGHNGKITFSTDRDGDAEVYVMNADGTGQAPLTANTISDANPTWSPDGTRIAFERPEVFCAIWLMNADGTGQAQVYPQGADPAWSPDATQIAFSVHSGIAVVDADGSGYHEVTPSYPAGLRGRR